MAYYAIGYSHIQTLQETKILRGITIIPARKEKSVKMFVLIIKSVIKDNGVLFE